MNIQSNSMKFLVVGCAISVAFAGFAVNCFDAEPPNGEGDGDGAGLIFSIDPNDIIGPAGKGDDRYVARGDRLEYTIDFENVSNATASAQMIYITLPKDKNLDWSTLMRGEIALGSRIDSSLDGKGAGCVSKALKSAEGWTVRSEVSDDGDNIVWYLRIWDETTFDHFPEDVFAGILPPNDPETHCGEGRVTFSVCVKQNAPAGEKIRAEGIIQFDYNDVIPTDPSWWNTVGLDIAVAPFERGIGYHGYYDGDAHGIDVKVLEPKEGAVVKYSETADGPYTTTPVTYTDVGTNTVFFTVEKAGYVPYSGSAKVIIDANDGSPLPIEPGETSRIYETEEAATNELARLVVTFPADLAEFATAEQKAYYCSLFRVVTKKVGDRWQNVVEFTPEATTALRKTLDDALKTFDLSKITTEDTNWVVPNPVMGLYYALERTDSLTEDFKVHEWDIGNSVSITFVVNETGKKSGFFRLVISACPPAD